ncbi:HNH endonuclease signature motif containing protein [Actinoplanes sp. RD1]|uniref:HNH endonuclease signature motif containing protein n=1 Tax=Actinoplanes sp. RD1 TaxID=3064538 RepID=UPI002740BCEE|nr:HNH endonuclease signature motif containing protein [Actinoplanes sp. RD1]
MASGGPERELAEGLIVVRVFDDGRMLADVRHLGQDAAKLAASPLWPLADDELTEVLRAAHRLEQAALALQANVVQQAASRGLPRAQGHRSTGGWVRSVLVLDPQPARELTAFGAALQRPAVQDAVLDGRMDLRQAAVVAATCDVIPGELADCAEVGLGDTAGIVVQAEATQIEMAERLPAYQLRRVGERILAHVAPEIAERIDEAALARQEARAHAQRGLTLASPVRGLVRVSGQLGVEEAAIVQAALHPLCTPAPDDERSPAQRRADALTDVCRLALRTGELPSEGGEPAQLAVTVAYDPLTRTLGGAVTEAGEWLSAGAARRLACDARVLPLVLGGAGQVLDAGRSRRLATGSLRRALAVRDGGCAFPDCGLPPRWTDAHHIVPWSAGGGTALDSLVLLCRRHHRLAHDDLAGWQIRLGADRLPDFIPPSALDPLQRPRRNLYHPRR